ncbi:MAG: type II secretion system F family protein [Acidimicrobiales bacterium]
MTGLLIAVVGGYGVYLLYTALVLRWQGLGPRPEGDTRGASTWRRRGEQWLTQAGLEDVRTAEFAAVMAVLFVAGAAVAFVLFGSALPALVVGGFAASYPVASYRARRQRARRRAGEAWPRMIEEIALLSGSLGRSVPQALFEVGESAPAEMRPAFAAAHREWLISTDFARTAAVLKARLADATADATAETLLVAHEVGGTDLDRRLSALVEDRIAHLQGRKDAEAKQAGVKFARRFVLFVPFGMALAGLSIGDGRQAYESAAGQVGVVVALAMVIACWVWSGRIMRLPEEERVFVE